MCVGSRNLVKIGENWLENAKIFQKMKVGSRSGAEEKLEMVGLRKKSGLKKRVLRVAHACTTFQCECPRAEQSYLLRRSLFHILFPVCASQNKQTVGKASRDIHRSVTLYWSQWVVAIPSVIFFPGVKHRPKSKKCRWKCSKYRNFTGFLAYKRRNWHF